MMPWHRVLGGFLFGVLAPVALVAGIHLMVGELGVAGAPLLYLATRITPERVLENPTRRAVLDAIAARPGIRAGTIARALVLDYGTVRHHVRVLQACALVEAPRACALRQVRLFARSARLGREAKDAAAAASSPVAGRILAYLAAHGEADLTRMCDALGMPKSSASTALSRLVRVGMVSKARRNRRLVAIAGAASLPGASEAPLRPAAP